MFNQWRQGESNSIQTYKVEGNLFYGKMTDNPDRPKTTKFTALSTSYCKKASKAPSSMT